MEKSESNHSLSQVRMSREVIGYRRPQHETIVFVLRVTWSSIVSKYCQSPFFPIFLGNFEILWPWKLQPLEQTSPNTVQQRLKIIIFIYNESWRFKNCAKSIYSYLAILWRYKIFPSYKIANFANINPSENELLSARLETAPKVKASITAQLLGLFFSFWRYRFRFKTHPINRWPRTRSPISITLPIIFWTFTDLESSPILEICTGSRSQSQPDLRKFLERGDNNVQSSSG